MAEALADFYVRGSLTIAGLCAAVVVIGLLRDRARSGSVDAARMAGELSTPELAMLGGGTDGIAVLTVVDLLRRDVLALSWRGRLTARVGHLEDGTAFERAAFATVHREARADLHGVRDAVRRLDATRLLLDGLVDRGLVRRWGARLQTAPDGESSWVDAVVRTLVFVGLLVAPFLLLSVLAGDDLARPLDDEPGALVALASGLAPAGCALWLARVRTAAGRAVVRCASDAGDEDESRAVALRGTGGVVDARTRRALKWSQALRATRYAGGGG